MKEELQFDVEVEISSNDIPTDFRPLNVNSICEEHFTGARLPSRQVWQNRFSNDRFLILAVLNFAALNYWFCFLRLIESLFVKVGHS